MKIIKPSFSLHTPQGPLTPEVGLQLVRFIEFNARISHRSEDAVLDDSWKRFIDAVVMHHGDWSVTEVSSVTAVIRTDRGVTHELVRHRHFSFVQESTRFVSYKKREMEFIKPAELEDETNLYHFNQGLESAYGRYISMVNGGVRPQEARAVLPNALAATISVTGNLRNWRHFFLMRTSVETHPDFKAVTIPMLAEFKRCVPLIFDDIEPNQRQIENLRKAR